MKYGNYIKCKLHKVPKKILSNRRPQFTSRFMEKFMKVLGTTRQLLITYHSQSNRQTERINQETGTFSTALCQLPTG